MLDIKFIRENLDLCKKGARDKNMRADFDLAVSLDHEAKEIRSSLEAFQNKRNEISKKIATAQPAEREALKAQVADFKPQMEDLKVLLKAKEDALDELMLTLPNPARKDVPVGKDDSENVEVKKWGTIPEFKFKPKGHAELGVQLGIIDFERGVKLAGSRSYVLVGEGAQLEQAVLRYTFDKLVKKGYQPYSLPVLVKEDCMTGTGYFPLGRDQAYYVEKDQLALVGTAEVPLTSFYSDEMLKIYYFEIRFFVH
jgi:seryl-tRNA synthetase